MNNNQHLSFEILRWGYANIPGAILYYSKDLEIDAEDLGIVCAIFYAYEQSRPLMESGVQVNEVLRYCSALSNNKLSRRLNRMRDKGLIELEDNRGRNFAERVIYPSPLLQRVETLIVRDHPLFDRRNEASAEAENFPYTLLENFRQQIEKLEKELLEKQTDNALELSNANEYERNGEGFRRVAEFISQKTGNLLSPKMEGELKHWLYGLNLSPEFLLCVLELSFEHDILNPRELGKIARELKEYGIYSVEGLELYFDNYVDQGKSKSQRAYDYDPEIIEFAAFTGIDMNAEARKNIYYKWRFDWGFQHIMIMKAGELMCQRTRNGGLQYVDSVLNNWMSREIRTVDAVEKELSDSRLKNKAARDKNVRELNGERHAPEHEIYVPPDLLKELKTKA